MRSAEIIPEAISPKRPLYHGTNMFGLFGMLVDNRMDEGAYWNRPNEPHGPRLTKNFRIAKLFALQNQFEGGAILEFDTARLAASYQLVEYRDVDHAGEHWTTDEREVAVITSAIEPLDHYLRAIYIRIHKIPEYSTREYAEWGEAEHGVDTEGYLAWIKTLPSHPLLRPMK